ncbi:MAG: hypothetical protein EGP94_12600 [Lachnospiraceae bacterium]|nr:hypothetical protein [Lachnospiraceae bacterium]
MELPSEVPASYCVTRRVCENSSGWFYRVAFATRHIGRDAEASCCDRTEKRKRHETQTCDGRLWRNGRLAL